jgi:glycosyltransferase involved in cell wall biosynthesis
MKVAFVLPRYGPTVVGGAETAARALAEGLATRPGWEVEVLTGRAEDFVTWDEVFPRGVETINGVTVRRFDSVAGRTPEFHPFSASLLADPGRASFEDANRWIDLQGPVVPEVTEAAIESDAGAVVFFPYLYYPTVRAIEHVRAPTLLHPAAHDEPPLYLPVFPPVFESASGLVFQTTAERDLVQRTFPVASHHQILLGLGVDDPDPLVFDRSGSEAPFLLCLGRVEHRKGSSLLSSLFSAYKKLHPGSLRLVFAGPVVEPLPDHPEIDVLGPVSEAEKWSLLTAATAVVSPSAWEAFSLVIIEAWSARTAVVVNGACAATVEHCRRSAAGLSFSDFGEFEAVVDRLVADQRAAALLGQRGREYVDRWFRWPQIVDRYATFIQATAAAFATSDA